MVMFFFLYIASISVGSKVPSRTIGANHGAMGRKLPSELEKSHTIAGNATLNALKTDILKPICIHSVFMYLLKHIGPCV